MVTRKNTLWDHCNFIKIEICFRTTAGSRPGRVGEKRAILTIGRTKRSIWIGVGLAIDYFVSGATKAKFIQNLLESVSPTHKWFVMNYNTPRVFDSKKTKTIFFEFLQFKYSYNNLKNGKPTLWRLLNSCKILFFAALLVSIYSFKFRVNLWSTGVKRCCSWFWLVCWFVVAW